MPENDVAVIGGGPAGSTAATMLARQGWRVALYERERFPREHVGESLLPASLPILEELGALEAVGAAGFVEKPGATMVWGTSREPWSWYFRETNRTHPHSYQVSRPEFDKILLENAQSNGVDVREQARVLGVEYSSGRATGLTVEGDGTVAAYRYVVDASGQAGLIGRELRLRVADDDFRNLAVYGYVRGAGRLEGEDAGNIFIESTERGWTWAIPLADGVTSVGVVADAERSGPELRRLGARAFFDEHLGLAPRTEAMVATGQLVGEPRIVRDWSYVSERVAGPGWVLAGDAACFVDPLFSSGVHLAMSSGVLAAAHVTTALQHPEMEEETGRVYQEMYYQQYYHFRELARLFYASNRTVDSYFWEARRITEDDAEPREAFVRAVAGQPPMGYERAVLEHGELPERVRRRFAAGPVDGGEAPAGREALMTSVPRLADGVELRREPVLGRGEFEWGHTLRRRDDGIGEPVSAAVATVVSLVDGQRTVSGIVGEMRRRVPAEQGARVEGVVLETMRALYTMGTIARDRRGVGR